MTDLTHIDTWLFDLDDTLYGAETALMDLIRARITSFVMRLTGQGEEAAKATQRAWFEEHGAALPGLLKEHNVPPEVFLEEIHDVPLDRVPPDPALQAALARLPGRKLIFTNGSAAHAGRVLDRIGVARYFDGVFHIESAALIPKPAVATFQRMIAAFDLVPDATAFFEDSERNLAPAFHLGMTTVLVGSHAITSTAPFVQHRTATLAPFLNAARVKEPVS